MNKQRYFFRAVFVPLLCIVLLHCTAEKAAADGENTVYVTNSGKKYHLENCSSLRRSKIAVPLADAVKSGFSPCSLCKPPQPSAAAEVAASQETALQDAPARDTKLYRLNLAALKSVSQAEPALMLPAEVVSHVDGDTVRVRIADPPVSLAAVESIRMIGVDTPETVHPSKPVEAFGKEASDFTKNRLFGKPVLLAFDWDLRDRYGRLLAYIYTEEGLCHNAELIRSGYAHAYTRFPFQFMDEFRALEQEARRQQRGLWAP